MSWAAHAGFALWSSLVATHAEPNAVASRASSTVAPATRPLLELETVLASVREHHPLLDAADHAIGAARGRQLSARGAFDPRLRVRAAGTPLGGYRYGAVDTEVRVRTVALGMVAFAGWRLGRGDIPAYDGRLATADGGELRAGIEVPVLRDALVDAPRTLRRKADIDAEIAELERAQRGLEIARDAAIAYWDWAAALGRAQIRERQLALARDRDEGIRRQIAEGNTAAIESLDNARVIATREAIVVSARRDARISALAVSLFLRTNAGRPELPDGFTAPPLELPALDRTQRLDVDDRAALSRRPELRVAAARLRAAELDVRLARNGRLPALAVQGYAAKDIGDGPEVLRPAELGIGATLEIPIPFRTARGELATARATAGRLGDERRFLAERVTVEVHSAHADMTAALARATIAGRQADLAEQLADAERDRFALGDSNILLVNLREESAADAAASAVDATADYHKSRARYQVATGMMPRS
ncbi:MAG: TolC family protein [Deltaproteobacteria bacterium]|nr:TolC family protein [Nannocystaceae bacterium]